MAQLQIDPLYVIFEQHLYNFQDSDADRKTFISNVVSDYLTYLRKLQIAVPKPLEGPIVEELMGMVNTMLVKKIYGCPTIDSFQRTVPKSRRIQAGRKYSKLAKRRT